LSPSEVLKGNIHLEAIDLNSPEIFLIREPSGQMNIHDMSAPEKSGGGEAAEKGPPPDLNILLDKFKLSNAAIKYASLNNLSKGTPQEIKTSSQEILRIPALEVVGVAADIKKQEVNISEVSTTGTSLLIKRLEDGVLNLETLAGPPAPVSEVEKSREGPSNSAPSWVVMLKRLVVKDYSVKAEDLVPETGAGVLIDKIDILGEGITTRKNEKGKVAMTCRINESGLLNLDCDLGLSPLQAGVKTGLEKLNLASIDPFAEPYFPGLISKGAFSLSGQLSLKTGDDGSLGTLFKGDMGISDFGSVDRLHSEDLIKFKSLKIKGIDLGTAPMHVNINEIALDRLFARIGIDAKGNVNLIKGDGKEAQEKDTEKAVQVAVSDKSEKADKTKDEVQDKQDKPLPINIGRVILSGGHIQFSDKSLNPGYRTDLTNIKAQVKGLSSKQDKEASLALKGLLDRQGQLDVSGRINPLAEELFVDIKVKFQNMGLSGLSPYSGKYIGKKIAKGKLFIDLAYVVDKRKLKAENMVFLDQFTLGEPVDSPDSMNLPVDLASR
ncbi:DUF748 domain-containing protein, partial [Thermodesulfobacteriota bacterium]